MDIAYNKTDGVVLPITNTRISASEYNQIAASLMQIITSAGLTPDAANNVQLLNALKAMGSGWPMPSDKYINLTLGASGTTYTAPANGWISFARNTTTPASCGLRNNTKGLGCHYVVERSLTMRCFVPCQKNDVIEVTYWQGNNTVEFKFIYAEGSKWEAN